MLKMNTWIKVKLVKKMWRNSFCLEYDSYLSVEIESTEKGCVEDEDSTEKFLVEPKVTHFDQDVVVRHLLRFFATD